MKNTEIIKCLKANKSVSAYELYSSDKDSRELFYVLDHLEINRAVKTNTTSIVIYVNTKKTTGTSSVVVTAADDIKSLTKKIQSAVKKAKDVKNDYYPIAEKTTNILEKAPVKKDLNAIANKIAEAVFKGDHYKMGWINSTEIFVSNLKNEFVNSNGVKHVSYGFKVEVECIPTWKAEKEEIELYKFYASNKIDYAEITKEVNEILNLAKLRADAKTLADVKLPNNIPVLVKNDMLEKLEKNLTSDLSYRELYMHQNHYKLKDVMSNNKFDVTLKPVIKGCLASSKYDENGVVLKAKKIVKDGVIVSNFGDVRYAHYLGKKCTGNLKVCELTPKKTYNYKKAPYLQIENFSSPQLEPNGGYWGGEVRLAKYFDGKKIIPLTGFSISGSLYEDLKNIEFSKETITNSTYKGPKYFIFKGISIH